MYRKETIKANDREAPPFALETSQLVVLSKTGNIPNRKKKDGMIPIRKEKKSFNQTQARQVPRNYVPKTEEKKKEGAYMQA